MTYEGNTQATARAFFYTKNQPYDTIHIRGERMGTSLTSIHIFGNTAPVDCGLSFRSFSPNWLTCIDNFSENTPDDSHKMAKIVSKQVNAPVLYFGVFDSERIWFCFFHNGRVVSRYSDDESVSNKKLSEIPSLVGYGDGYQKRLSSILGCSDVDLKIAMLEEYFGVSLLFSPELLDEPDMFFRERTDKLYRQYQASEKALTGKSAPISLKLIAEYPGKLFWDVFGAHETIKPHFFLYGYPSENLPEDCHRLTPVRFTGSSLEPSDFDTFGTDRMPQQHEDLRFEMQYGTPCKVRFSEACPPAYRGKTMTLPNGFYPEEFLPSGELLLQGNHRIFVVDHTFKIIAKLSIKGDIADVLGNYILTASGDSFCGYCYEPKAKIYIYAVIKR